MVCHVLSSELTFSFFVYFDQALEHYDKKGVSHQDVCLENIVLDDRDRAVLVDPGLSLRVPHCGKY